MEGKGRLRWLALIVLWCCTAMVIAATEPQPTTAIPIPTPIAQPPDAAAPQNPGAGVPEIVSLVDGDTGRSADGTIALNHKLWVVLRQAPAIPASRYVLVLNGTPINGLTPTETTYKTAKGESLYTLVFRLARATDNAAFWNDLLSSPKLGTVPVEVSLGERAQSCQDGQPCVVTPIALPSKPTVQFRVYTLGQMIAAVVAIGIVLLLVWGLARSRTTLRDNLLPQIEASRQPYSLGRWQMAFWFTLIFAAFVFLYVLLWDTNTITTQALCLMGISGATALASVAVDVHKDSPADAVNRGLQALGLNTYEDVLRVRQEIAVREKELAGNPSTHRRHHLQLEIRDREVILQTYTDKIRPFLSQGWFADITTDLNGTALHRLQVLCWTVTLGIVFVLSVYHNLEMPQFNGTLLALMGISSAGYVGFKLPEVNS